MNGCINEWVLHRASKYMLLSIYGFVHTFTEIKLKLRNCSGGIARSYRCSVKTEVLLTTQFHATIKYKPNNVVLFAYLKPISYPSRPSICLTGTGCLSKVGVVCKNDMELMPKIRKLKGYCLECYNHSLEALGVWPNGYMSKWVYGCMGE